MEEQAKDYEEEEVEQEEEQEVYFGHRNALCHKYSFVLPSLFCCCILKVRHFQGHTKYKYFILSFFLVIITCLV